jgi:hypothetical protein
LKREEERERRKEGGKEGFFKLKVHQEKLV